MKHIEEEVYKTERALVKVQGAGAVRDAGDQVPTLPALSVSEPSSVKTLRQPNEQGNRTPTKTPSSSTRAESPKPPQPPPVSIQSSFSRAQAAADPITVTLRGTTSFHGNSRHSATIKSTGSHARGDGRSTRAEIEAEDHAGHSSIRGGSKRWLRPLTPPPDDI